MTEKEKAIELVEEFRKDTTFEYQEYAGAHYSTFELDDDVKKQCALIAVDEILIALNNIPDIDVRGNILLEWIKYWVTVKQEIKEI